MLSNNTGAMAKPKPNGNIIPIPGTRRRKGRREEEEGGGGVIYYCLGG